MGVEKESESCSLLPQGEGLGMRAGLQPKPKSLRNPPETRSRLRIVIQRRIIVRSATNELIGLSSSFQWHDRPLPIVQFLYVESLGLRFGSDLESCECAFLAQRFVLGLAGFGLMISVVRSV
jgi:hypothetical protein